MILILVINEQKGILPNQCSSTPINWQRGPPIQDVCFVTLPNDLRSCRQLGCQQTHHRADENVRDTSNRVTL